MIDGEDAPACLDPITRLPNRQQFHIDQSRGRVPPGTLVVVTLAESKTFNQILRALGHGHADNFLRAGAERLVEILGKSTLVYHVSPLSFAFRLPGRCEPSAPPTIDRVVKGFRVPILVADIPVDTRIGIGMKFSGGPGASPAEDLRAAGSAAAESHSEPSGWAWYDADRDELHRRSFLLLNDLKAALDAEGQLQLHYQPKIVLASGVCESVEALLRWTHPLFGPVPPGEFIPLAETTALANLVTRWVIDESTRQMVIWRRAGLHMRIAINISPKNLEEPDFVEYLLFVCSVREIPHDRLELEVTEGIEAAQGSLILDRIAALREFGFGIAIDDFGSGYSNMAYLTRLSAKTLKIDRSLVHGAEPGQRSGQLVAGVVRMAHDLGYSIVAEGIETESECQALSALGCDIGQGWLFGRPMSAEAFLDWHRGRLAATAREAG